MKKPLGILKIIYDILLHLRVRQKALACQTHDSKFKIRGYTLTELSISTSVIAMLAVGGLAVMQKKNDTSMAKDTVAKLEKIDAALKGFINAKGYIPCPAAPSTLESSTSFGNSTGVYNTTTKICSTGLTNETGMVPVRTLGLSDDIAYDGWGRKFTYRSASSSGAAADFGSLNFKGNIAVIDLKGVHKTSINEPPPNNEGAIYIIISHGANGKNVAWRKNVATTPPGDSGCGAPSGQACGPEAKNTNHGRALYIQNDKTSIFDDVVVYGTKAKLGRQIVMESPIRIEQQICDTAQSLTKDGRGTLDSYATQNGAYVGRADTIYKSATVLSNLCKNRLKAETVNPSRITGLKLWLDAADRATLFTNSNCTSGANPVNNNTIGCWKDKSGSGYNALPGNSPLYVTNVMNSKPVIRFDGSSNYLLAPININYTVMPNMTVFTVYTLNAGGAGNESLWGQDNGGWDRFALPVHSSAAHGVSGGSVIGGVAVTGIDTTGSPRILTAIYQNGVTNGSAGYINGALASSTFTENHNNLGETSLSIGSIGIGGSDPGKVDIGEMVIYNSALSTADRNKMEEYLSDKWGIQLATSTSTCGNGMVFQKTAADPAGGCKCPAGTTFVSNLTTANACYAVNTSTVYGKCVAVTAAPTYTSPPSKNGMVLWLDANDCTTIGLASGTSTSSVKSWADKSGLGNNAIQNTAANQPVYTPNTLNSKPVIRFDGTNDYLITGNMQLFTSASSPISAFIVFKTTNNSGQKFLVDQLTALDGEVDSNFEWGYDTGNGTGVGNFGLHQGNYKASIAAANTIANGNYYIMSTILQGTGSTPSSISIFQNGTSLPVSDDNTGYLDAGGYQTDNAPVYIGARKLTSTIDSYHSGDIAEIMLYNTALSNQQRDSVESYLAGKWGIVRNATDITPTNTLKVWLDANDKTTVFTDSGCTSAAGMNDKVGCWKDKSGNNYNATQTTARYRPTYGLGSLNTRAGLLFDGYNDTLSLGDLSAAFPSAATLFITVTIGTKSVNNGYFSIFSTKNVDSWWRFNNDTNGYFGMFRNVRLEQYPAAMPSSGSHVFTIQSSSSSYEAFIDGTSKGVAGANYSAGNAYIIGGPDDTNTYKYFGGPIAEIIIYNSIITATQRLGVERYLGAKWGITVQ